MAPQYQRPYINFPSEEFSHCSFMAGEPAPVFTSPSRIPVPPPLFPPLLPPSFPPPFRQHIFIQCLPYTERCDE